MRAADPQVKAVPHLLLEQAANPPIRSGGRTELAGPPTLAEVFVFQDGHCYHQHLRSDSSSGLRTYPQPTHQRILRQATQSRSQETVESPDNGPNDDIRNNKEYGGQRTWVRSGVRCGRVYGSAPVKQT